MPLIVEFKIFNLSILDFHLKGAKRIKKYLESCYKSPTDSGSDVDGLSSVSRGDSTLCRTHFRAFGATFNALFSMFPTSQVKIQNRQVEYIKMPLKNTFKNFILAMFLITNPIFVYNLIAHKLCWDRNKPINFEVAMAH